MSLFFPLTLTTALLYWAGCADVLLPVKVKTIHRRRPNSIPVTEKKQKKNKQNPLLLSEYFYLQETDTFLASNCSSKPSQSQETWNKAHRCFSSEAEVSLGTRLGRSISQLSLSLSLSLPSSLTAEWVVGWGFPLSARWLMCASYRALIWQMAHWCDLIQVRWSRWGLYPRLQQNYSVSLVTSKILLWTFFLINQKGFNWSREAKKYIIKIKKIIIPWPKIVQ